MKVKEHSLIILSLFLMLFVCIGSVSALENQIDDISENEVIGISESPELLTAGASDDAEGMLCDENVISSDNSEGYLNVASPDNGTFKALQEKINNAQAGDIIVLENDYANNDGFDTDGISISKAITIDGNGYAIDALLNGSAFQINSSGVTIQNIVFKNNYNDQYGGAVYWIGDGGLLTNCSFFNCSANCSGGALYCEGADFVLGNCSFFNCSASFDGVYGGGAVYLLGEHAILGNCSFSNCSAGLGGAVYFNSDGGILGNCSFSNCSAFAGAVSFFGDYGVLDDCSFDLCSGSFGAGGVNWQGAGGVLDNCSFVNCSSGCEGGAVAWEADDGVLTNCSFINCTSRSTIHPAYGGAVFWCNDGGALANCSFIHCSADSFGGAVCWMQYGGVLGNCSFVNCSAGDYGGAVAWDLDGSVGAVLGNCSFVNCFANYGGGIYIDGGVLGNCSFADCIGNYDGGAIYLCGDEGVLDNCSFVSCFAGRYGGAVYWDGANGVLGNCSFTGCRASFDGDYGGGAVYWDDIGGILANSSFVNCSVDYDGGAVYWNAADGVLGNCAFVNCSASQGSAVYSSGEDIVSIENNWWASNNPDWDRLIFGLGAPSSYAVLTGFADKETIETKSKAVLSYEFVNENNDTLFIPLRPIELSATGGKLDNASGYVGNDLFTTGFSSNETGDFNITASVDNQKIIIKVTVSFKAINVDAPDVEKYYGGNERFVVNVTDYMGNPLENKSVSIVLNGATYNRTTDANGTASIGLNLNSGVYNVTTTVDNITVDSTVTVKSTVNGTDIVKVFRNATAFYATFLDSEGNCLANGTMITFNINGVFYNRTVGENGLAKLNINLEQGNYVITSMNTITGENAANNVTVIARLVENRDIVKYYRNASQYTVKVLGDDGSPVGAGETVKFNINGVFYERETNESGIAKLNINLQPGDYVITAEYKNCRISNNITVLLVLSAENLTKNYGTKDQFVATLVDGQGSPYANQTVTFNINGVFYNRTTDSSGQAKLNINLMPGEYIITSSYNGTNVANTVTVKS